MWMRIKVLLFLLFGREDGTKEGKVERFIWFCLGRGEEKGRFFRMYRWPKWILPRILGMYLNLMRLLRWVDVDV